MFPQTAILDFASEGAVLLKGALRSRIAQLEAALTFLPPDRAGVRILRARGLSPLLGAEGVIGSIAASILGATVKPVRAVAFNKSLRTNWSLGWHQDRTICVKEKRETPGYGPWTMKRGFHHVEPPFDLLTKMVTLRVHLDDVPATNGPLLIAPGSHTLGRIPVSDVDAVVRQCGTKTCIASSGDVWLYATPILHASEAASTPKSRRVLQVDYAAEFLPEGLEWLGI